MKTQIIYSNIFLVLFLVSFVYASSEKVDYNLDYNSGEVGVKWGASNDSAVLQDKDETTFYGLSGAGDLEIPLSFTLTNISSVEISWQAGPNNIAPSNYYFGYFDEIKKDWVFPSEWSSSGSYQEFNILHKFVLNNPVETSKVKLVREGTGPGSGIAISELYAGGYKTEETNTQTSTESGSHSSTRKSSSKRTETTKENLSVISSIKNETFLEPLTLSYENSKQTDNYLLYLAIITVILILIYSLLKILKR